MLQEVALGPLHLRESEAEVMGLALDELRRALPLDAAEVRVDHRRPLEDAQRAETR